MRKINLQKDKIEYSLISPSKLYMDIVTCLESKVFDNAWEYHKQVENDIWTFLALEVSAHFEKP